MLVSQGEARSLAADRRLAWSLAAVAGALNAAAFQAVGFFSANMTGNVSSASARVAGGDVMMAGFYGAVVAAFIGGATASSLLINLGRRQGMPAIYAYSILAEALLMTLVGMVCLAVPGRLGHDALILGLSFLMGLQNAVVTRISAARVRTTHVSGMVTDIGIALGVLIDVALGRETGVDPAPFRAQLRLHVETVLSFLAGGVVGVMVYRQVGAALLLGTATCLLALALPGIARARRMAA